MQNGEWGANSQEQDFRWTILWPTGGKKIEEDLCLIIAADPENDVSLRGRTHEITDRVGDTECRFASHDLIEIEMVILGFTPNQFASACFDSFADARAKSVLMHYLLHL